MPADDEIWSLYSKQVKPLQAKKRPVAARGQPKISVPTKKHPIKHKPNRGEKTEPKNFLKTIDRHMERRLKEGDFPIDGKLDLHGMRQDEAHEALHQFIDAQLKRKSRCLLIITGKGRDGKGVLRANMEGWLMASRDAAYILALRPAAIKHGGTGAFYLLLKRQRATE